MKRDNLDIRIIQLAKWQIPKATTMQQGAGGENDAYLAIGYFDMIEIIGIESCMDSHPLLTAYQKLPRHKQGSHLEEYTTQEMILFTDVGGKGIPEESIQKFWDEDSLLMFVSLIHVDNESDIDEMVKRIQNTFAGKNYLYYFSFDYSGIVLLAKNMRLDDYTSFLFRLNYEDAGGCKLIRDSYSMVGLEKKKLKAYFDKAKRGYDAMKGNFGGEIFSIVVNIGVQNFSGYKKFVEAVRATGCAVEERALLGRHDISIINDAGNLKWLIYVQYLLDQYSIGANPEKIEPYFSTYETFLKVPLKDISQEASSEQDHYYDMVKEALETLCGTFSTKLQGKAYNGEYLIPVRAVKDSILSILKNRFAEDFVLSMYASFCEFLSYLTDKMSLDRDNPETFDRCYREYFRGLNSLVNSAMHSERQFIQATAFNALIYDVPAKIMAFYVAMIYDIQQIIRNVEDKKYTFLLTPSFSNEIEVEIISYQEDKLPHDRIMMVSINERSLYNPKGVACRMAHEVAHYLGDELRNRKLRKQCFKLSVIYIIFSGIFHPAFTDDGQFDELLREICDFLPRDERFCDETLNYSDDLNYVGEQIAAEFVRDSKITDHLHKYIQDILRGYFGKGQGSEGREGKAELMEYISQIIWTNAGSLQNLFGEILKAEVWSATEIEIMANLVMRDIENAIQYANRDRKILLQEGEINHSVVLKISENILSRKTVGQYADMLRSIYAEAFSDIQMILLLGFSYQDYLEGFILEEKIDLDRLENRRTDDDLSRLAMVTLTMNMVGLWSGIEEEGYSESENEKVQCLHRILHQACCRAIDSVGYGEKERENIKRLRKNVLDWQRKIMVGEAETEEKEDDLKLLKAGVSEKVDIASYLNSYLVDYLLECVNCSVKQYLRENKVEEIRKLRDMIQKVIACENIRETFKAICAEVKGYKEKIFLE